MSNIVREKITKFFCRKIIHNINKIKISLDKNKLRKVNYERYQSLFYFYLYIYNFIFSIYILLFYALHSSINDIPSYSSNY